MVRRVALAVAVVTMLTAFGSNGRISSEYEDIAGTRIRFAVSLQPEETRVVSELVKRFEARTGTGVSLELFTRFRDQSGVQVTVQSVGAGEMEELVRNEGSGIHLFALDNGDLAGLLEDDRVQAFPLDIDDGALAMKSAGDGKLLPFRPNVRLTYANREKFGAAGVHPPETVKELEEVAERLGDLAMKEGDPRPKMTLSLSDADGGAPAAVTISELVLEFGGRPEELNSPGTTQAFELLRRLWADGSLARESFLAKHDTEVDYLMQGAIFLAQNWSVTSATLANAGMLDEFTVHRGWQDRHVVGGDVLGLPAWVHGDEKKAAAALAQFLMSQEAQAFLVERNAWPAIRDDAYEGVPLSETITALRLALKEGWYRPTEPYWDDVVEAMNKAVHRIVLLGDPVEPVLQELQAEVEQKNPGYLSR